MAKLTEKQKQFCDYYLETANGTESAIRAGYSKKTAPEIASENLNKPNIRAYIDERIEKADSKRIASANEVLEFFSGVMRGEIRDQFDLDPALTDRINAGKELAKRYGLDKKTEDKKKERIQVVICSADDEDDEDDDEYDEYDED